MRIKKAQIEDFELIQQFLADTESDISLKEIQHDLSLPEESLYGVYLLGVGSQPLIGVWVKRVRNDAAIRRVVTLLAEEDEEFQDYFKRFLASLQHQFRASGKRSLFIYTSNDFVTKYALESGFELYKEYVRYEKRDFKVLPIEGGLPVTIRPFVERDLDGLVVLEQGIYLPEVWNDEETFLEMAQSESGMLLVAELMEQVVGYSYVCLDEQGVGHVSRLGVHMDYQRFGIGKQLLVAGIEWLQNSQVPQIELYVRRENLPARVLYERFGFVEEGIDTILLYSRGGV